MKSCANRIFTLKAKFTKVDVHFLASSGTLSISSIFSTHIISKAF